MKLDDLPWLISDHITLLGVGPVQPLKPCDGMFRVRQQTVLFHRLAHGTGYSPAVAMCGRYDQRRSLSL